MLFESQSSPSYSPSPEVAHVLWIYLQGVIYNVGYSKGERQREKDNFNNQFYQWRWRREWRPSLSVISAAFIALGRSCLFANTSSTASLSSSCQWNQQHQRRSKYLKTFSCSLNVRNSWAGSTSFNILCSSSLASTTRSRSLLSTTKISPCVFWK